MRRTQRNLGWVVYRMTLARNHPPQNAVCEQGEWDEMEKNRPGYHTLIRAGICDEAEAEKFARGTSGDALGRRTAK